LPGIFPDYPAPIVRNAPGEREIVMEVERAAKLEANGKPVFQAAAAIRP
jgi:hypothetical protein